MISRRFVVLVCAAALFLGGTVHADDREPYRIRLVLSVARHPLLTKVFQEQLARELRDGLQAALGELAKVEVDNDHPKLDEVRKHGLGLWMDSWGERSPYQTHFVQIDYTGTAYTIQTRQHDGLTGLASPVVRRDRTRDRAYVARTAALLIERNLGLLGTVETEPNTSRQIQVSLKGGRLGVDLSRWVKKGEVFALVQPGGRWMESAYLQVEEPAQDGVCQCRLYTKTLREFPVTGLRCVLLGTHNGPLRLRLVQQSRDGSMRRSKRSSLTVQIRRHGFEGEDATCLQMFSDGSRDVDTSVVNGERGKFNRLAFVTVLLPGERFVRFPVPLVDDSLVVLKIPESTAQDHPALFRFESLRNNILSSCLVQKELFEKINNLSRNPDKRAQALAEVRKALTRAKEDYLKLNNEHQEVAKALAALKPEERPSNTDEILDNLKRKLSGIHANEKELLTHLVNLEKILKEEDDPKRKEWLIQAERAKGLVSEGELGDALDIYKNAPPEFMTPALKKHIEELEKRWKPVNDKHAAARKFIYKVWPTLSTTAMEGRMKEAADAVDVCKRADDDIGLTKMLKGIDTHVQRLESEARALKPEVNIDDEKPLKMILALIKELRKLDTEINDFLEKKGK